MKGTLIKYVIDSDLVLTLLLEDGTEVEGRIDSDIALALGDDIFHLLYTREDDDGKPIRNVTRTLDSASGHFLDIGDGIEYEREESEE